MHLMFDGQIKNALLNGTILNKPAHAALINVPLKQSMDASIIGQRSDLTVTPAIHGMVKEAEAQGKEAYEVWVAQIAGELVHKPQYYAEHGFTVPLGRHQPALPEKSMDKRRPRPNTSNYGHR